MVAMPSHQVLIDACVTADEARFPERDSKKYRKYLASFEYDQLITELRQKFIDDCVAYWFISSEEKSAITVRVDYITRKGLALNEEEYRKYLTLLEGEKLIEEYKIICGIKNAIKEHNQKSDELEAASNLLSQAGEAYKAQQKKFRQDRQKVDDEKHEEWRKWQAAEKASNPQFAKQSKQEQAKRLKQKYRILDKPNTIAKRLDPLPSSKK